MADDAKSKADATKPKTKTFSKWATTQPTDRSAAIEREKRQQLWDAMQEYVRESGGWITSVPGVMKLRIEVPQGSPLPAKLIELGYAVSHCGSGTRLAPSGTVEITHSGNKPVVRHHAGFVPIDILEIALAGGVDAQPPN
jgi:hypothetical protein